MVPFALFPLVFPVDVPCARCGFPVATSDGVVVELIEAGTGRAYERLVHDEITTCMELLRG